MLSRKFINFILNLFVVPRLYPCHKSSWLQLMNKSVVHFKLSTEKVQPNSYSFICWKVNPLPNLHFTTLFYLYRERIQCIRKPPVFMLAEKDFMGAWALVSYYLIYKCAALDVRVRYSQISSVTV